MFPAELADQDGDMSSYRADTQQRGRSRTAKKPCVGSFGSFGAELVDGMCLSLSTYGLHGEPEDGQYTMQTSLTGFISNDIVFIAAVYFW